MWRFAAILVLAVVGMVWFLSFADLMQQCALVPAFGAAVILTAGLIPGLLFGTMASLGLERSWLADVESSRR